jgi:hypothetical protein
MVGNAVTELSHLAHPETMPSFTAAAYLIRNLPLIPVDLVASGIIKS